MLSDEVNGLRSMGIDMEKEDGVKHADRNRPPTSDESGGDGDGGDNNNCNNLQPVASERSVATNTLSKARSVALVVTVTGAAFLNASSPYCSHIL